MEPWIDIPTLEVWTRKDIPAGDPFALTIIEAATIVVSTATGYHLTDQEFTPSTVPQGLKVIVAQVAKRNYLNPDQITREGNIGPLGGDTYAAAFAAGMTLTEQERMEINRVVKASGGQATGGLSVLGFRVSHNAPPGDGGVYAPDSSGSDWQIPIGPAAVDV